MKKHRHLETSVQNWIPVLKWGPQYTKSNFNNDFLAAIIVTIMLIPQSLAYALLAGLPPEMGLYASILPLVAYAIFGTSKALAIGPVAIISLMTATAAGTIAVQGSPEYIIVAITLAFLTGIFLLLLGLFRLGFLTNFISHPVISGFITASGLIIAASQLKHLFGIEGSGHNLIEIFHSLLSNIEGTNLTTLIIGLSATVSLFLIRSHLKSLLTKLGLGENIAEMLAKTGPIIAVALTTIITALMRLDLEGVKIVGHIPNSLPELTIPSFDLGLWFNIAGAAALISIIGFIESISVAKTLAAKKRQYIDPDQELIGLGSANIVSAFSGGYTVTGGFARSAISFDAGAETPAAGAFTAIGITLATLFLIPWLYFLPQATLSATIIVAVLTLVDLKAIKSVVTYSKRDASAMITTILITLLIGIEIGILAGICVSIMLFLIKTSTPHFAIVGLVCGTEHFRNVDRHEVICSKFVKTIRIDESLYFANARFLESTINKLISSDKEITDIVLMCPAVNEIDTSALHSLIIINKCLKDAGVRFHLSEVKGPVMDRLERTDFINILTGKVFLSQYNALAELDPELIQSFNNERSL